MKNGYLVEYSKKKGVLNGLEERQTVLCSNAKLIELLQNKLQGIVWSAHWVDVQEYQANHESQLEEWGFNK